MFPSLSKSQIPSNITFSLFQWLWLNSAELGVALFICLFFFPFKLVLRQTGKKNVMQHKRNSISSQVYTRMSSSTFLHKDFFYHYWFCYKDTAKINNRNQFHNPKLRITFSSWDRKMWLILKHAQNWTLAKP